MVVLLKFRLGRISLCYNKGVWSFYFREYTYNFCDRSVKERRCNVTDFFFGFFFPPGGKKNPSQKLNTVWNLRKKSELSCKIRIYLYSRKIENHTPFAIPSANPEELFRDLCIACVSVRFLSLLKFNQILISKPISFSRNMFFFLIMGEPHRPSLLVGI